MAFSVYIRHSVCWCRRRRHDAVVPMPSTHHAHTARSMPNQTRKRCCAIFGRCCRSSCRYGLLSSSKSSQFLTKSPKPLFWRAAVLELSLPKSEDRWRSIPTCTVRLCFASASHMITPARCLVQRSSCESWLAENPPVPAAYSQLQLQRPRPADLHSS